MNIFSQRQGFDGAVRDMGSREDRGVTYMVTYVGKNDSKLMREFVEGEAMRKGVEVVSVVENVKGGKLEAVVTFRSMKGII